jgi:hypothetical protein
VAAVLEEMGGDPADPLAQRRAVAEVARRFDRTHDVHRAAAVGSVDRVIAAEELRPVVAELVAAPGPIAGPGANGSGRNGSGADGSGAIGSGRNGSTDGSGGNGSGGLSPTRRAARRAGTSAVPV